MFFLVKQILLIVLIFWFYTIYTNSWKERRQFPLKLTKNIIVIDFLLKSGKMLIRESIYRGGDDLSMSYNELLDLIESPNSFSYEYNSQKDNSSKPSKEYSSEEPSDNSGKSKSKKYSKYSLYVLLFIAITLFMFIISVFIETIIKYAFVCPTILVSWIAFKLIYKFSPKIKDKLLNVVNFNILPKYKPLKTITVIALLFASALSIYPKTNALALELIDSANKTGAHCIDRAENELSENTLISDSNVDNNKEANINSYVNFVISNKKIDDTLITSVSNTVYMIDHDAIPGEIIDYLQTLYENADYVSKSGTNSAYLSYEDEFLNQVTASQHLYNEYGVCEKWKESLANEEDLLNVIDIQQRVSTLNPSYDVFNKISNNYQRLALEYEYQNGEISAIKYYYLMSAYYDILSINYATEESQYNKSMQRLYYRVNDILSSNCNLTDFEIDRINYLLHELKSYAI